MINWIIDAADVKAMVGTTEPHIMFVRASCDQQASGMYGRLARPEPDCHVLKWTII